MSSVPGEVLKDILQPLSRWTLDAVQLTDKRFRQLIFGHMSDVCLRQIYHAVFQAPNEYEGGRWFIRVDNPPTREISRAHEDTARLFSEFVQALSSSCLGLLTLCRLVFTPQTAELLLQTTIHSGKLCLMEANCAELTSAQFREVLLRFSPSCLSFDACHLRQCQISDELIQAIIEKRARFFSSDSTVPLDSGRFCVTDAAIVDFCSQPDVEIRREGEGAIGELELHGGIFTKGLFQRLVEASAVSARTQPLRIVVSPVHLEDEDLRGFEEHLSYRDTAFVRYVFQPVAVYEFEQHGAATAMHLKIELCGDKLTLIRARPDSCLFEEPDEVGTLIGLVPCG